MVKGVRVAWSIFGTEAPFDLIAGDLETELPSWGDCEDGVLAAVNVISARYFGDAAWERLFGLDLIEAEVLFQIEAPAHMAGAYEVALRRVTTAACKQIKDPPSVARMRNGADWLARVERVSVGGFPIDMEQGLIRSGGLVATKLTLPRRSG